MWDKKLKHPCFSHHTSENVKSFYIKETSHKFKWLGEWLEDLNWTDHFWGILEQQVSHQSPPPSSKHQMRESRGLKNLQNLNRGGSLSCPSLYMCSTISPLLSLFTKIPNALSISCRLKSSGLRLDTALQTSSVEYDILPVLMPNTSLACQCKTSRTSTGTWSALK